MLGGGLVTGSVTLIGGEPGIGKSTLLLQLLASWPSTALYVTAEESAEQVRQRAERLGAVRPDLWLLSETSVSSIVASFDAVQPTIAVIDSIQTIGDPSLNSAAGSVVQVRGCAQILAHEAKRRGIALILVGHVTKDGSLAGPRVLEHLVDTVLTCEGERYHSLRVLRATKHRFGPTDELGLFTMTDRGLTGVPDAASVFLGDRQAGVAGSAVVPTIEGRRPLVIEVQALTTPSPPHLPARRTVQGIDTNRLSLLLAVINQRTPLVVANHDVYVSTVGGLRHLEPGLDLGVCLAIASALTERSVTSTMVAIGEVGLGGEIRQVPHLTRRLTEAVRLGFREAIIPSTAEVASIEGLALIRVSTLAEALVAADQEHLRTPVLGADLANQKPGSTLG